MPRQHLEQLSWGGVDQAGAQPEQEEVLEQKDAFYHLPVPLEKMASGAHDKRAPSRSLLPP